MKTASSKVIRGKVWKFGDSVDTGVIAPHYRAPTPEELRKATMDAYRPEFAKEVKPGDIIVGGKNFGYGSSRETAHTVLRDVGIAAIVAESVSALYFRQAISFGMPIFAVPGVTDLVEDGDHIEIDYAGGAIRNPRTGKSLPMAQYPPLIERIFKSGGIIPLLVQEYAKKQEGKRT